MVWYHTSITYIYQFFALTVEQFRCAFKTMFCGLLYYIHSIKSMIRLCFRSMVIFIFGKWALRDADTVLPSEAMQYFVRLCSVHFFIIQKTMSSSTINITISARWLYSHNAIGTSRPENKIDNVQIDISHCTHQCLSASQQCAKR